MKKIVYIGNNLNSRNPTTLIKLSELLRKNCFRVEVYGSNSNKIIRLFQMIFGILKNFNTHIVLIDTYSTTNFYFALIISQLCRVLRIKYIPILHGGNLPKRFSTYPTLSNLIFANSAVNVSPSKYLVREFKKVNFNVNFIPNSLDLIDYKFKIRKKIKCNLLWVRAFDAIYNPQMAIKVLKQLITLGVEAKLCMVGPEKDGSLAKTIELVKKYKLTQEVQFTGYLSKKEWLKKSEEFDIFINTTTIDNIPVSVIEAMALGLPVVSTNVGGIPYLIEHGKNGLLVRNNNVSEMSQAIINLAKDFKLAEEITKNAREMIEPFDTKSVETKWEKLLLGQFS